MKKIPLHWLVLSIVVVLFFVEIWALVEQDDRDDANQQIYQALDVFVKIDDIAHYEINEDPEENPFTTQILKDEFYAIDHKYHETRDIEKKYNLTKKMVNLLEKAEHSRPHVENNKNKDLEKDEEYAELLQKFQNLHK